MNRKAIPKAKKHNKALEILSDDHKPDVKKFRKGAFAIPVDILEQKLLLHKGMIMMTQGENFKAK